VAAAGAHLTQRFADTVIANLERTLERLDTESFDAIAALLADTDRNVAIVGGRITGTLAEHLYTHLQVIRDGVTLVSSKTSRWPHHLLSLGQGDVLAVFDIRRYEDNIFRFVELAQEQGVAIVVITDQWGSPTAKHARHVIRCRIEAPSAWDSSIVLLFIVEALIADIESRCWAATSARMRRLEELFERSRLFKKFT
jgi:DNA-binding MurR/RpiR family transcriptional regulator